MNRIELLSLDEVAFAVQNAFEEEVKHLPKLRKGFHYEPDFHYEFKGDHWLVTMEIVIKEGKV